MNDFEINDVRDERQFKGITFSKFKRTDAKKELLNSLSTGHIEKALNWSAEFICCGCLIELWDIILNFVGKHIHLGNPKLPIYLEMRFNQFKEIISTYSGLELNVRNNMKVRKIFAEIITVICNSKKRHSIESIKIKKADEFDMTTMASKLKAPNVNYAVEIFKKDDPKELYIAINELAYHVSKDSRNALDACYWLEWILEFENMCKKRKDICICERRSFVRVAEKFVKEPIWMIWDVLFIENAKNTTHTQSISKKILKSIFELFCMKYTSGAKKKRKYLLYFAISLLIDTFDTRIEIIDNKETIDNITKKINLIYKEIKKNEQAPEIDYLLNGVEKSNKVKTFEKLEALNNMNTIIRS